MDRNNLLQPETLTSRPGKSIKHTINTLESKYLPEELYLSEGSAATYVERLVFQKKTRNEVLMLTGEGESERLQKDIALLP